MQDGYPSDWNSRRKEVYRRDDYLCQNCGSKGGSDGEAELHAHHIVPKSRGGTHELSNLQTVCSRCHNAIHGKSTAPSERSNSSEVTPDDWPLTIKIGSGLGMLIALYLTAEMGLLGFFLGCGVAIVSLLGSTLVWTRINSAVAE